MVKTDSIISQARREDAEPASHEDELESSAEPRLCRWHCPLKLSKAAGRLARCVAALHEHCSPSCLLRLSVSGTPNRRLSLLPPCSLADCGRLCAIVDLDETLVHSSFQPVARPDFVVAVPFGGIAHRVYVLKRPHVDLFLLRLGQLFECVLFTASTPAYASPVVDKLDRQRVFRWRLYRDSCTVRRSTFVKDLSRLGRSINRVVIIDNSPDAYVLHPHNAVAVSSWFGASDDTQLLSCLSILERISSAGDVYRVLGCPGTGTTPHRLSSPP